MTPLLGLPEFSSVNFVEQDNTYAHIAAGFACQRSILTQQALGLLSEVSARLSSGHHLAMYLRGSFARGDPSPFSDYDIILVTKHFDLEYLDAIGSLVSGITGRRTSVRSHPLAPAPGDQPPFSFWLSLPHLRLFPGPSAIHGRFLGDWANVLRAMPLEQLVSLYMSDPLRSPARFDPDSPHSASIKRGMGGTLDSDFIALLKYWQHLRRADLTPAQLDLYCLSQWFRRYLATLKSWLSTAYCAPLDNYGSTPSSVIVETPAYFAAPFVRALLSSHYILLLKLVETLEGTQTLLCHDHHQIQ
jgi:hypothetical protein